MDLVAAWQKLLQDGKAGVVAQTGEFFVLRLGADTSRNDEALDQLRMSGAGPGTKTAPRPTVPKITPDVSALPDPGRSPPAAPSDEPDERPTP